MSHFREETQIYLKCDTWILRGHAMTGAPITTGEHFIIAI